MGPLAAARSYARVQWKRGTLDAPAGLACCAYAASSTGVTILNKLVFSASGFHYPWFTLAFQNLISVFLILLGRSFRLTTAGRLSRSLSGAIAVPVLCFVAFIFTNAQALRYLSLPVLTVWKSLGPLAVTLVEASIFKARFTRPVYLSMVLIALSALVTARFDLQFSPVGYAWAAGNLAANVAYLVSLRVCLNNSPASSLDKTFHSNLLSLILIVPLSLLSKEFPAVLDALSLRSPAFKVAYGLSGALTTAVCASAFWTIQLTSGSTMSFIGGMNKIPIILISLIVFDDKVSVPAWIGVGLGVFAGIIFVRAKAHALEPPTSYPSPKFESEPLMGRSPASPMSLSSSVSRSTQH